MSKSDLITLDFKSLTILDRWIISKTHQLLETAESSLKDYRVDLFMKSFELYLEELSNWYIRRNRRRFWKSEDDQDKNNAYLGLLIGKKVIKEDTTFFLLYLRPSFLFAVPVFAPTRYVMDFIFLAVPISALLL